MTRVFIPNDAAALSMGADKVASMTVELTAPALDPTSPGDALPRTGATPQPLLLLAAIFIGLGGAIIAACRHLQFPRFARRR